VTSPSRATGDLAVERYKLARPALEQAVGAWREALAERPRSTRSARRRRTGTRRATRAWNRRAARERIASLEEDDVIFRLDGRLLRLTRVEANEIYGRLVELSEGWEKLRSQLDRRGGRQELDTSPGGSVPRDAARSQISASRRLRDDRRPLGARWSTARGCKRPPAQRGRLPA
jgi:hypothetical protein